MIHHLNLLQLLLIALITISCTLISRNSLSACADFPENIDCYDYTLKVQKTILNSKASTIEDISGSKFSNTAPPRMPNLKSCRFCDFKESTLRHNLENIDLSNASFLGAFAQVISFQNSNLKKTNFRGAKLYGAKFSGASVQGTDFEAADLSMADFREARIDNAIFDDAIMIGTKFPPGFDPKLKREKVLEK